MKQIILFSFLVFYGSQYLKSQDRDNLLISFNTEFQEGNYQSAIEIGSEYLSMSAEKDTSYLMVLRYMAFSSYALEDYDTAVKRYEETRELAANLIGKDNYDYIMLTFNLAVNYTYVGKYSLAFPLMDEVIDFIVENQTKNSMDYINMAIQQANIYSFAGSIAKAEEIYDDVWNLVETNFDTSDSLYVEIANIVAPFYVQNGIYEKAEPFYTFSVKAYEEYYGKLSAEYLTNLNSLGEFYLYAGMYGKMEAVYAEFVDLCREYYGENSADYATSLNNLAVAYEKQGKNREAEELYQRCLNIKVKVYKKESDFYALTLSNLAVLYDNMARYSEAEKILNEAITIYREVYGESNPNYPIALSNMASLYSASGKYENAIELLQKAASIQKNLYGEKYNAYINTLNSLAVLYEQIGSYDLSETTYQQTATLRKSALGSRHTDYAVTLSGLANIKMQKGKYIEAEQLLSEALDIQKEAVGKDHVSYLITLNSLANLYSYMGNYQRSGEIYESCKVEYERLYGDMHPEYATFLNNLGLFYYESGNYSLAHETLKQSLYIQETAFGENHPDNVNMLTNLANVMLKKGELQQAESFMNRSVSISRDALGENHPMYISSLLGLGVFYYNIGNYSKSEEFYLLTLSKQKSFGDVLLKDYATTLNNLGALYLSRFQNVDDDIKASEYAKKAEYFFHEAASTDSIMGGTNHPSYAMHLNNLAELYRLTGEFEKAERLYLRTIDIETSVFGTETPSVAVTYHNLGLLYAGSENYSKAELYCKKSLEIKQITFGADNPVCADAMVSLAYVYEKMGRINEAKNLYAQSISLNIEQVKKTFTFLSEEEKSAYLSTVKHYNDLFASFALKYTNESGSAGLLYDIMLFNKGLLLRSSAKIRNNILNSNDKNLIARYSEWIGYRQQLAKLYALPEKERYTSTAELEDKANIAEKEIAAAGANISGQAERDIKWTNISESLKENEAAIEFGHYKELNQNNSYNYHYYAVVLKSGAKSPNLVYLCSDEQLQIALSNYSTGNHKSVNDLYFSGSIYKLVWEPLDSLLHGAKTVYISPDGMLHKISFAALIDPKGRYVSDFTDIQQVSTTGLLCLENTSQKEILALQDISLFGGVNYGSSYNSTSGWKYLEGSLTEIERISKILSSHKISSQIFLADKASEENLKRHSGEYSPNVIHIATHGFFFPSRDELESRFAKEGKLVAGDVEFRSGSGVSASSIINNANPLLRSGLVMAGANITWSGNQKSGEDGILNAYEVSNLNLDKTQLVVLSACETGLGDIKGSEGVYGLQRAFKMAGAKYIVMSLWQVPDKETVEFMEIFYSKLLKQKDIRKSFAETQSEMRKKYDPYYWAAFVLVE